MSSNLERGSTENGPNGDSSAVLTQGSIIHLAVATLLGTVALLCFSFLRPKHQKIYARRLKYVPPEKAAPPIPSGFFSWLRPVIKVDDEELLLRLGMDATSYLTFLRGCLHLLVLLSCLLLPILIPINMVASSSLRKTIMSAGLTNPSGSGSEASLENISLGVTDESSTQLHWAHVVLSWVISIVVYVGIYRLYRRQIDLRTRWFSQASSKSSSLHHRTILLTHLPKPLREEKTLYAALKQWGVDSSEITIVIGRKVGHLPYLLERHRLLVRKLESVLCRYLRDPHNLPAKRPKIRPSWNPFASKVDAISHYYQEIEDLEAEIEASREKYMTYQPSALAFLVFPRSSEARISARRLRAFLHLPSHRAQPDLYPEAMMAPPPVDIIWSNLVIHRMERTSRRLTGNVALLGIVLVVICVVGWVTTLANLSSVFSVDEETAKHSALLGVVQSSISPILYALFTLSLPKIISFIGLYQGIPTRSGLDRSILKKLFLFFFVNNIVVVSASMMSTLWKDLTSEGTNLGRVVSDWVSLRIVVGLIHASYFWISFIGLRCVEVLAELAQVVALVFRWLRRVLNRNLTPREEAESSGPANFPYAILYAAHLFLFQVALMYSIVSPLILLITTLNFALSCLVYKYQLMYVYTTSVETDGRAWPTIFNRIAFAVILGQLFAIAAVQTVEMSDPLSSGQGKKAHSALAHRVWDKLSPKAAVIFPLPFISIICWWLAKRKLKPAYKYAQEERKGEAVMRWTEEATGSGMTSPTEAGQSTEVDKGNIDMDFFQPAYAAPLEVVTIHPEAEQVVGRFWETEASSNPSDEWRLSGSGSSSRTSRYRRSQLSNRRRLAEEDDQEEVVVVARDQNRLSLNTYRNSRWVPAILRRSLNRDNQSDRWSSPNAGSSSGKRLTRSESKDHLIPHSEPPEVMEGTRAAGHQQPDEAFIPSDMAKDWMSMESIVQASKSTSWISPPPSAK